MEGKGEEFFRGIVHTPSPISLRALSNRVYDPTPSYLSLNPLQKRNFYLVVPARCNGSDEDAVLSSPGFPSPPHQDEDDFPISHQLPESTVKYHEHVIGPNQWTSFVIQQINAPISIVWSLVQKFDNPQSYKHFIKSCYLVVGDDDIDTLRE